jgi:hypothetical protein
MHTNDGFIMLSESKSILDQIQDLEDLAVRRYIDQIDWEYILEMLDEEERELLHDLQRRRDENIDRWFNYGYE